MNIEDSTATFADVGGTPKCYACGGSGLDKLCEDDDLRLDGTEYGVVLEDSFRYRHLLAKAHGLGFMYVRDALEALERVRKAVGL